jgi:hypothetical protein
VAEKKKFIDGMKEAAEDYASTYSKSAKELGDVASEIGSSAMGKVKAAGSEIAKQARNYGRTYKEGLGMKPDTPYEKKKGGMVNSASKRADGIAQRGKTRGRLV